MDDLIVIDLFCGAGGAARGIELACQDAGVGVTIIGVDNRPQPRYPYNFLLDEWNNVDLDGADFVWASPPCQKYTSLNSMWNSRRHPDLVAPCRAWLKAANLSWVIENVPNAPLLSPVTLCGTMFNLQTADGRAELRRHRLFEASFGLDVSLSCTHGGIVIGVYGGHGRDRRRSVNVYGHAGGRSVRDGTQQFSTQERKEAMGIDWMTGNELSQAVPPAYSRYIFSQWLRQRFLWL
jgi:DNA (cytosine-5)-methyltransferase 1